MFTLKVEAAQKEMKEAVERSTETIMQQVSQILVHLRTASNIPLVELWSVSIDQRRGHQGCVAGYVPCYYLLRYALIAGCVFTGMVSNCVSRDFVF